MNSFFKWRAVIFGILCLVGGIYFAWTKFASPNCANTSVEFAYGCTSYRQYQSRRTSSRAESDTDFLENVLVQAKNDPLLAGREIIGLARTNLIQGDLSKARRRANQAWLINQNNYQVAWIFALTASLGEKYPEALTFFERAFAEYDARFDADAGDHARLICDVGTSLTQNKRFKEAITFVKKEAPKLEVVPYQCSLALAESYLQVGDKVQARDAFLSAGALRTSLHKDPRYAEMRETLGIKPLDIFGQ